MLCDKELFESVKRNETTGALLRFETTTGPASIAYIYRKGKQVQGFGSESHSELLPCSL